MKLVVVGGVAGGASVAARVRRLNPSAEIVIFERGEYVSFSNCSLPYYLSGTVARSDALVMMTPEKFRMQHNIDVRVNSMVTAIDRAAKKVTVRERLSGRQYEESYDKLILAPGAEPIRPKNIPGVDGANVFTVRNVTDIQALKNHLNRADVESVAVIGGGFIGIEVAENIRNTGKQVSIFEGTEQIMAPFDPDMVQTLHRELLDHGVALYLSTMVVSVADDTVTAKTDDRIFTVKADAVVLAVGMAPEISLAVQAGLDIGGCRGIKVNHNYQTNDPDIYAVGDAVESYDRLGRRWSRLQLAGPAQRQARAAADHICGMTHNNKGFIGSSCIRIFGQNAACTGLNEKTAKALGLSYEVAYVFPPDKVSIMPESHYLQFKLLFEVPTGRLLGAQAIGRGEADKRVNVIAAMISMNATLEDLKELELCYSPIYSTAKDVVNIAALVGLNLLYGQFEQVRVSEVRALVESGAYIVDVREKNEFAFGHLKGAKNIPLSQLRERIEEIPRDVPVYLYCRSAQRSYYALCAIKGAGFRNIKNISGGFLGISLYEYFNDKYQEREPIVTHYNFN